MTVPMLIEYFREVVVGNPERLKKAELLPEALRKFTTRHGNKHNGNTDAYFFERT
jgi:hypothetical protein